MALKPNTAAPSGAAQAAPSPAPAAPAPVQATPGTAVANVAPGGAVTSHVPGDLASLFLNDAQQDRGYGKDDLSIPFLRILQQLSPACNANEVATYVQDAMPGMFLDTLNKELWTGEEGVLVVPVHFEKAYLEWHVRGGSSGSGLVKNWGVNPPPTRRNDKNQELTASGTEIIGTATHYVLLVDEETGATRKIIFALAKTGLKQSKTWLSLIDNYMIPGPGGKPFNPAPFYRSYRLQSQYHKNDKGHWFGPLITPSHDVVSEHFLASANVSMDRKKEIYIEARSFRDLIASGKAEVKYEQLADAEIEVQSGEMDFSDSVM